MKDDNKQVKYPVKWMWILGIIGFQGLDYFKTGDVSKLFLFSYFAFFAYYFLNYIIRQRQDERMLENHKKVVTMASRIPFLTLFVIGLVPAYFPVTSIFFIVVSAFGVAGFTITYVSAFFYYERYT